MKRSIRRGVFETNSSSVHTLSYVNLHMVETNIEPDENGVLHVPCRDYSDVGFGILISPEEKLEYYITYYTVYYYNSDTCLTGGEWIPGEIQTLINVLNKHCKTCVNSIVAEDKFVAAFDHQTHPSSNEFPVSCYDENTVESFIFSDNIELKLCRD